MTPLFNGTFVQSFDAKGRVSVPARFRDALRAGSANPVPPTEANATTSLVLRPSDKVQCIEVWTEARHHTLIAELEKLDPLSDEYDALAIVLFSRAYPMETDKEGRVIVPDMLLSHAGIDRSDRVTFLGMGTRFELWNPALVEERVAGAISTNKAWRARGSVQ